MKTAEHIIETVDKLVRKYHTRDPYELCQLLGIKIHYYDLQKKLKGFFYYQSRQKNIVIDHNVNGILERILVAHELGHAVLHTKIAMMHGFQEMEVFDDRSIEENEANFFAAELLLEDGKVLECLSEHTFFETAKMLYVPAALLDYKFSLLHEKGELVNSMYIRKADFLKEDLHAYFKGGVGKSKLSTMFAYLTDKFNLKVLMIDKDLQATLTKDLAKTFKVELPRVNFYEGLKNGNLASSIVHLTDNLDLIPGTFDLMLLPKLTRSWTFENESRLLATLLAPLKSDYDLIIIDTVPTPSVYTNNAIVASDYVMIPLQAEEESTNNIQNYISYLIDLQEQFNPGLDMIGFVPYLVDTDSATIKSNLEELYKQHKEDNLVFQNIIKRSNKVSTWSKNGITEHKGYDKLKPTTR